MSSLRELGSDLKDMFQNYDDSDIKEGPDVVGEMLVEYAEDAGEEVPEGEFDIRALEKGLLMLRKQASFLQDEQLGAAAMKMLRGEAPFTKPAIKESQMEGRVDVKEADIRKIGQAVKDIFETYTEEDIEEGPDVVGEVIVDELVEAGINIPANAQFDIPKLEAELLKLYKLSSTLSDARFGDRVASLFFDNSPFQSSVYKNK